jgi:hypothetical protein
MGALIVANSTGLVTDVDLFQLKSQAARIDGAIVDIPLFSPMLIETPLVASLGTFSAAKRDKFLVAAPFVRTRARLDDFTYLKEIHLDSVSAVRERDTLQLELNLELYEAMVTTLVEYEQALASRGLMSIVNDTDLLLRLRTYLYSLHQECMTSANPEAAHLVSWAIVGLMKRATDSGNSQIARDFLRLLASMAVSEVRSA